MLGLIWKSKKEILHKYGEDDIIRQNATMIQIHSHVTVSNSFNKGTSDNKA
jgi:hypothetical protein